MERLRNALAQDPNLYPDIRSVGSESSSSQSAITVSSTSSSSHDQGQLPPPRKDKGPIIVSSDEEEEENVVPKQPVAPKPAPGWSHANPTPIAPPANAKVPPTQRPLQPQDNALLNHKGYDTQGFETFQEPAYNHGYDPIKSREDVEKEMRELMSDSVKDEVTDINMEDRIVPGFQKGIELLPHQILGRQWMRDRETDKKHGGILADDMGLGKTIQTLTRIVEGRPKRADREDGWDAPTLVVCPLALVDQWAKEISKMAVGLTVIQHHGSSRTADPHKLKNCHVVVTTYQVVTSEYAAFSPDAKDESSGKSKKKKKAAADSDDDSDGSEEDFGRTLAAKKKAASKSKVKDALYRVNWWRIVLDEAHNIKNRNAKSSIACCALESKFQWCLTGTPLQNNVEELYSLFKFCHIKPLNDWNHFNTHINKPVKAGRSTRPMKRLQVVLKAVLLRRTKDHKINGVPVVELPARNVEIVKCDFDEAEREFYTMLEGKMEQALNKLLATETGKNNYVSMLTLLLRLRQACDHPILVSKDYKADQDAVDPKATKSLDDNDDQLAEMFGTLGVSKNCQLCQKELNSSNISPSQTVDIAKHCADCAPIAARAKAVVKSSSDLPPDSAKIRKLIDLLQDIEDRGEGEKTIVFSQFTSMLDLIEPFLRANGIKFARYDGSMARDQRDANLHTIRNNKHVRVILISFKAGSTGLNLTACNNVILLDLWWNPALEDQAFDRAHRFGQERDVNIFKLTIENTVEDRILSLQEKKRLLAAAALSGDKIKNMKLTMDDLLALFRGGHGHDDDDDD